MNTTALQGLSQWLGLGQPDMRAAVHRFGAVGCAAAIMPFVPNADWRTAIFVLAYLGLPIAHGDLWLDRAVLLRRRGWRIALFVMLCAASLGWLLLNGGQMGHWGRAIVPFLFLLTWFHLPTLTEAEARSLARWLLLATVVWLLRLLLEVVGLVATGSDVLSVRLTTRVTDSVLPYPLLSLPLLFFWREAGSVRLRATLAALVLFVYVWIGYRGGLLIVAGMLLAWFLASRRKGPILLVLAMLGTLGGLSAMRAGSDGIVGGLVSRFSSIEEESSGIRALEWAYALDQWLESPIVGKGLGWQVPGEVTFFGLDDDVDIDKPDTVGYVHSAAAYFLMSLGVLGAVMYFATILPAAPRPRGLRDGRLADAAAMASWMLCAFFLTEASFRQVQTTMFVMALLKIACSLRARDGVAQRAKSTGVPAHAQTPA